MGFYDGVNDHHPMIFDNVRNNYYFNAIKNVVNEESVVLDLGAGLGIHGLMAFSAGAKKVYLVEPAPIIDTTKKIIETNDLSDNIECIVGKIEEIELPEKVDVIISVFTGDFLLSEDLLPSLFYARDKFLRPEGKLIPDLGKMIAVPVCAPEYYKKHIDCWSDALHDVDFSLARTFATNTLYLDKPKKREAEFLSNPMELLNIDFMTATEAACRSRIEVEITNDGILHGWLGWFDAKVGDEWLSTSPKGEQMHWRQVFLPTAEPFSVKKGDKVIFELNRPEFGDWSWIVESGGRRQKHSTFLSEPISPSKIMKKLDNYKPGLSQDGRAVQVILSLFDGTNSKTNIVYKVMEEFPSLFKTYTQAEQFVQKLIGKYS